MWEMMQTDHQLRVLVRNRPRKLLQQQDKGSMQRKQIPRLQKFCSTFN